MTLLLSTTYLPPVSYVAACFKSDRILIEAFETYPRQTYRNRCCICGPNGKRALIIPVTKPGGIHTQTKDIRIDYSHGWQKNHWLSIEAGYNKSPFFLYYQDDFRSFFNQQVSFLLDFNTQLLKTLFRIIRIDKDILFTDQFEKRPVDTEDLRSSVSSKHHSFNHPSYTQVFSVRHGFIPNLSIIDLLFNLGPETGRYFSAL